jgi:hypothetical protein
MANIFRFFNTKTGAHFFTSNVKEKDSIIANLPQFKFEVTFQSNAVAGAPGTTPVYRLYNESTKKHLFTSDKAERDSLLSMTSTIGAISSPAWNDEGISYHAYTSSSAEQSTPLYRFYNTKTDSHFYTSSEVEKNTVLLLPDYKFEAIAYYVGGPAEGSTGSGTTINLTANADTPSAVSPAANTLGTVGVETFSGVFDTTNNATITNADILDGAGGIDTLNIRVAGAAIAAGGSTIAPVSTNVEIFSITNQVSSGRPFTLDFLNIQDETEVWDKSSVSGSNTRMLNVDSTAKVGMENTFGGLSVNFKGDRSQGTTDAFKLDLSGAGTTTSDAFFGTITTSGNTDSSFEIANISSTKTMSNTNLASGLSLKTVNVSGDALLMLGSTDNFAGLNTVDASAMTAGGVMIDARDSTENGFVFKGSSAADIVLLKNSTIDTASLLDGGNGKDTLATTQNFSNLQTAVNKATNFEVLASIAGASTFDASSFTGINEFLFTGNTSSTNSNATFRGVESNDRIVLSTDVTSGSYAIRVEGKNVGTTATIELRAEMGTGGETVISGRNSSSNSEYGIELRTNISSLVIDSTGTGTNPNLIEVDSGRGGGSNYAIGNETTSSIKITGSHDLTILAKAGVDVSDAQKIVGFSKAANIDASDFSGALRIAGSLHDDIITGGSGNDIIYGMGGNDTITGNGGSDQFRLAEFYNKTDIIKDFSKGSDKVGLNQFDFTNTTQTQAGATLASTDYVENLNGITQMSSSEDKKLVELQTSVSGTQIASQTSSSAAEAYVLVHNSTTNKAEIWYDSDWSGTGNRSHILTLDNIVDLSGLIGMSNTDFVEYSF